MMTFIVATLHALGMAGLTCGIGQGHGLDLFFPKGKFAFRLIFFLHRKAWGVSVCAWNQNQHGRQYAKL